MLNPNDAPPNPIPAPIEALLELFSSDLANVKFPDVDGEVLSTGAARVRQLAEEVAAAEAALLAARKSLEESHEALLQRGHRALAYARIFAEDQPELQAKLEAIVFPRSARRGPRPESATLSFDGGLDDEPAIPKRRGRPPKAKPIALSEGDEGTENGALANAG